jgi:uncharacterized RDD family membrane protein YckC
MSRSAPEPRPARVGRRHLAGFLAAALTPGLLLFAAVLVAGPIDIAIAFFAVASCLGLAGGFAFALVARPPMRRSGSCR